MKNEKWATEPNRIHVSSKLPNSPATGYLRPDIKKIAVTIKTDDDDFIPQYNLDKNKADLLANLSSTLQMPTGSCEIIDCGITIEVPIGYKICVSSDIPSLFLNLVDSNRIKVNVLNSGKKLILKHKQVIGKIWIEPVYFFEWIMKG